MRFFVVLFGYNGREINDSIEIFDGIEVEFLFRFAVRFAVGFSDRIDCFVAMPCFHNGYFCKVNNIPYLISFFYLSYSLLFVM